jgi:hypothetical protein
VEQSVECLAGETEMPLCPPQIPPDLTPGDGKPTTYRLSCGTVCDSSRSVMLYVYILRSVMTRSQEICVLTAVMKFRRVSSLLVIQYRGWTL